MCADEVGGLGGVLVVDTAVGRLVEADAAGPDVRRDRHISDAPAVNRRRLHDSVERMGIAAFEEPVAVERAVVADALVVPAAVERTEAGRVLPEECPQALRAVV